MQPTNRLTEYFAELDAANAIPVSEYLTALDAAFAEEGGIPVGTHAKMQTLFGFQPTQEQWEEICAAEQVKNQPRLRVERMDLE